ncbi:hypothetical protein CDL15_Pgr022381 [Punica granatum]|uniref:Uncharacterized protein n=1 Tax=Punica granatum TaxID=22663 RepID=A0A218XV00_PUNGR|nr:hypothetical protein CDL15_Pgr022381 [Punica granatum]
MLQEARARWLGELAVMESKLSPVSRPGTVGRGTSEVARRTCGARKQTRQGCKRHEGGGSVNLRCRKVSWHGLANRARLQEPQARWLGELEVQEIKLARVSRLGKVGRGTSEVARRTCGAEKKVSSHGLADPARLQVAPARWFRELAVQESKLARTRQGCKRHERGGSANLQCRKVSSQGLADQARLQEARARWRGELAEQESKLSLVSRPGKVARGTSETRQGCKKHERGGSANLRCKKVNSHGLADLTRQGCKRHQRGGSTNITCRKENSHGLADPARLEEARARWLGELAVQESRLARTRQGWKRHERGGSANLRCRKVSSHGLADPARLQEAQARWFRELAVQESKLARVSRLGKVARGLSETWQGCKRHKRGGSENLRCRKVSTCGLVDPARLNEARARWVGELAVMESKVARVSRPVKFEEARARWLGELAVQESKLARVSRSGKVARGTIEVARRTCGARRKVNSHMSAHPARLHEERASRLGELAVQEIKLARVGRPCNVARGTSETLQCFKRHERGGSANFRCRKVGSHGLANSARLQHARARWLGELAVQESKLARVGRPGKVARGTKETRQDCKKHERGGSANLQCKKVNSHGLADRVRLQEARGRWLRELAVQEGKLARVSRLDREGCKRHKQGGSVNLRCKKVNSYGLADPAILQEARARWLGEPAVEEMKLALTRQGCKKHKRGGSANLRYRNVGSHGLANPARLQEAQARWLRELAVPESKLARTRQGCKRHERGGSANLRCRKEGSHGLANSARSQHARARWLGELAVLESKLTRVGRPGKGARGTKETGHGCKSQERGGSANLRCMKLNTHGLADPARLEEARAWWLGELAVEESKLARTRQGCKRHEVGGSANLRCGKVSWHGLADRARLQEPRARWLGELAVQESKLAQTQQSCNRHGRGGSANLRCRKVSLHGLADRARSQEAGARWLGEPAVEEIKLALDNRPSNLARGTREVARRTCGGRNKLARVSKPSKVERGQSEVARRTCDTGQGCKRHERGGSANLRCRKVSSHGLADPAMLQEARARCLGELAVQEDPARLHEARARWLGELVFQKNKLAWVSIPDKTGQGCKRHQRGGSESLRCRKVRLHRLAYPERWQEALARWLGDLAMQESKLARVSKPSKVARATCEMARRTCDARKKAISHGLVDPTRLQQERARWLGELAVQESMLSRVSIPDKVARGTSEVAQRTCDAGKKSRKDPARLQEARARWFGELAVQESRLARTREGCKRHKRGGSANLRCRQVNSHGLANPSRLKEARARWLGELAVKESKLARVSRQGKVARGTSEVARRTKGARK